MTPRAMTTYSDFRGRPVQLTQEELTWFWSLVEKANSVTGNQIEIIPYDFDLYPEDDRRNYGQGCICTTNPDHPLSTDAKTQITIDTWHIHESFDVRFNGGFAFPGTSTLEETIAHEIAHTHYWNHSKRHAALTQQYLALIQTA